MKGSKAVDLSKEKALIRLLLDIAGLVLLVTGLAKLVASSGTTTLLESSDPFLGIPIQDVLWVVGVFELVVALVCFFGRNVELKATLVAVLATNFLIYRIGLAVVHYQKPCHCMGDLAEKLHMSTQTADTVIKAALAYLLLASYGSLFSIIRTKQAASTVIVGSNPCPETKSDPTPENGNHLPSQTC